MSSIYTLSATTDKLLYKQRGNFKKNFPTSYKRVYEQVRVFLAYIETFMNEHKNVEDPSKRFIAPIHSVVLAKLFMNNETKIVKFLRENGLLRVEQAIYTEVYKKVARYDSPTAFKGLVQHTVDEELSSKFQVALDEYYNSHNPELSEDLKKAEANYKELFVNWTKADAVFKRVYRISLEDLKTIRISDNPMKNEFKDALLVLNNLERLQGKKFHLVQKHGRLYTIYHSLKKEFRDCIEHDYEAVVECFDMTASFPTIVARMGIEWYKNGEYADANKCADLTNFYNACKSGDIYSKVLPETMSRKEGKTFFLSICFSDNSNRNWKLAIADIIYNLDDVTRSRITTLVNRVSKQYEDASYKPSKLQINYQDEKLIQSIVCLKDLQQQQQNRTTKDNTQNIATNKGRKNQPKKVSNDNASFSRKEVYLGNIMKIKNAIKIVEVIRSLNAFCPSFYDFVHEFSSFSQKWNNIMKEKIMAACPKMEGVGYIPIKYKNLHGVQKVNLSIEAQKIESILFTNFMTKALELKHPDIFTVTLHDAIFTTESMSHKIDKKNLRELAYQILEQVIMPEYKFPKLANHPAFKGISTPVRIVA